MAPDGFAFVHHPQSSGATGDRHKERSQGLSYVQSRRRQKEAKQRSSRPWEEHAFLVPITEPQQRVNTTFMVTKDEQSASKRTQAKSPLPSSFPTGNASDPFNSTVAGPEPSVYKLLHFTLHSLASNNFLAEAFATQAVLQRRKVSRHQEAMQQRLGECIGDAALLYSTMAYVVSLRGWVTGKIDKGALPEYFVDKALVAVRLRMQERRQEGQVDHWLLMSLQCLFATEVWLNTPVIWSNCPTRVDLIANSGPCSMSGAHMHLNALLRLVSTHGGWGNMMPYLLDSAILLDKFAAIIELAPPVIPLDWDPGPVPPLGLPASPTRLASSQVNVSAGQGFQRFISDPLLLGILMETAEYLCIANCLWSSSVEVTFGTESWLFRRLQALMYRLLGLERLKQPLHECVRLASLVFLLSNTHHAGPRSAAGLILPHLQAALATEHGASDLALWCISAGAMAARPCSPDKAWFVGMAAKCAAGLQLDTLEEIKARLGMFLHAGPRQEAALFDLWEELVEMRQDAG